MVSAIARSAPALLVTECMNTHPIRADTLPFEAEIPADREPESFGEPRDPDTRRAYRLHPDGATCEWDRSTDREYSERWRARALKGTTI